jgi:hypothetical protein
MREPFRNFSFTQAVIESDRPCALGATRICNNPISLIRIIFNWMNGKRSKKSSPTGTAVALHIRRDSVASPESHWF